MSQKWNDIGIKDKIQYICAALLIISGIGIAFLSFLVIHDIANGVLLYIAQAFVAGGSIFGVSIYFNHNIHLLKKELKDILNGDNGKENIQGE